MQALILAAGIGNRLAGAANDLPKCLLEFNHRSLLERHIKVLTQNSVHDITIITGYKAGNIENRLSEIASGTGRIKTVRNDAFTEGSVVSLWTGKPVFDSGEQILLMDADVLYADSIIRQLVNSDRSNCFLLDRDFEAGDEPVKLCIKNNRIVEFRKAVADNLDFDIQGESVGFFRFSPDACRLIMERAADYIRNDRRDQPYEEVLRDVVLDNGNDFGYEDITGLPWIEIDFPEDIKRATEQILPQLDA